MITDVAVERVADNLGQRLRAAGDVLLESGFDHDDHLGDVDHDPWAHHGLLLDLLVQAIQRDTSPERVWLFCTALFGAYPTSDEVRSVTRFLEVATPAKAALWLLDEALEHHAVHAATATLLLVSGGVMVDVDHTARHDLHTGIQQVVRRTLPAWVRDHPVLPVAWTEDFSAWRVLSSPEFQRVVRWGSPDDRTTTPGLPPEVVVPWRTVVALVETPPLDACDRLAALAQYSGNPVVAVGYDCVPIVSADLVPPVEPFRFVRYLTTLKYARRIAGISRSATGEFRGFASAVAAQGLPGPRVVECALPVDSVTVTGATGTNAPGAAMTVGARPGRPVVLSVGSLEPRKNHLALLFAAESLWRDGLDFELRLIAGSGWGEEVPRKVSELRDAGRPISVRRAAGDDELVAAYRAARFTVLASLHEGFGLPVAESLAYGVPVITTDYGSAREIAASGGALLVHPGDDEALLDSMRRLLTDDSLLETLRGQIQQRPVRTWDDYAADLWDCTVRPLLPGP
jgi:glycosyltransferase involved in cell wall biosynthesis